MTTTDTAATLARTRRNGWYEPAPPTYGSALVRVIPPDRLTFAERVASRLGGVTTAEALANADAAFGRNTPDDDASVWAALPVIDAALCRANAALARTVHRHLEETDRG